ncbi:MAG: hypothetical protein WD824_10205, partial [Cyclobacteriaceae bacterium]
MRNLLRHFVFIILLPLDCFSQASDFTKVPDIFLKALFVDKTMLTDESLDQMLQFNKSVNESRKYLRVGLFKDFIDLKAGLYAYG